MDFQLNEEQLQLKKSVREFAEREIAPNVMKWDEAGDFPLVTVKELGKLGLLGTIFPPEYGGAGMGYVEYVTAMEELSRVDGSVGIIVAAHTSLSMASVKIVPSKVRIAFTDFDRSFLLSSSLDANCFTCARVMSRSS